MSPRCWTRCTTSSGSRIPGVKSITHSRRTQPRACPGPREQKRIDVLGYNPLPPAFELKLTDADQFEGVSAAALNVDEVRQVRRRPIVTNGARQT